MLVLDKEMSVRLPEEIIVQANLKEGDLLQCSYSNGQIILLPKKK
ncbi:AbrB/MazE/SpoVT family DNA-binding domain-containing protein [Phascolarctobacterium sp.]